MKNLHLGETNWDQILLLAAVAGTLYEDRIHGRIRPNLIAKVITLSVMAV